jgi:mono/diheme cytochrome c family protein
LGEIMVGIVRYSFTIVAFVCMAVQASELTFGQVLIGDAAYGSWHDDRPGLPRLLAPQDLPPIEKPTDGLAQVVPIPTGAVHVLRVPSGSAQPVNDKVFARGLKQPFGIAFYPLGSNPRWVYIANRDGVVRFRYRNGDLKATGKPERIIAGMPTTLHYARDIGELLTEDGSLILTEDGYGTIRRMTYHGDTGTASGAGARSRDLYIANCSACHQASGEGLPGVCPPLKGSGVVNKDDAAKHIQVVLDGMQGARAGGVVYTATMPPFAGTLSDAEIADIIDYERSSWGNHGTPVTAAQVAAERAHAK